MRMMKNNNNETIVVIGIDHGYGNMKTATRCFPSGVARYDKEPIFQNNLLVYNGMYYQIGEEHKENPEKRRDACMRKERKIINTNIRLNLCDEQDRQAWEYLQTMDREKYKSYTRAVVVALNDYFSREYRNEADPYLETREKEDAFLERVETAVRDGVKESVPMAIAKNLMEMLVPFVKESVGESDLPDRTLTMEKTDGEIAEDNLDWEKEADMDAALDFADSF